jgi:hypothetical protein
VSVNVVAPLTSVLFARDPSGSPPSRGVVVR